VRVTSAKTEYLFDHCVRVNTLFEHLVARGPLQVGPRANAQVTPPSSVAIMSEGPQSQ